MKKNGPDFTWLVKTTIYVIALAIPLLGFCACNHSLSTLVNRAPAIPANKERMRHDVEVLTAINPPRNAHNVESLNRSADYILEEFRKTDCNIEVQRFMSKKKEYKNIVCSFGPKDGERVVVGAHYDVFGDQPGADDNASGIAGLLELARLVHDLKVSLKYRTDFVAFTLEEPEFFRTRHMGSYMYAKYLADAGVRVRSMIALEMIGYYSDKPGSQSYPLFFFRWFYPTKGNYIAVVGKWGQSDIVRNIQQGISSASCAPVVSITAPAILPGIDFSDHQNFWKFDYSAVMVTDTAFFRNNNYHDPTDTIDTLDFDKMADVTKGLLWTVVNQ